MAGESSVQDIVQDVTDWSIFSILTLIELFVLIRLRFKIDFSGLLTLLIHFSVSLLRVMNNNIGIKAAFQYVFLVVGSNLIWFSLYYFTSEL
jgi:hypothetical protein